MKDKASISTKQNIEQNIESLICKEDARIVLRQILNVAKHPEADMRTTIPHILLEANEGSGITTFSQLYADIITQYHVLPQRGCNTFIELKYLKEAKNEEYLRFFQSARDAAGTQNKYWGVFLIRLSDWPAKSDLKDINFVRLMEYILKNKSNIKFVFHILPDAENKIEIELLMKQYINVKRVYIPDPKISELTHYAFEKAAQKNLLLDLQASKYFPNLVEELSKKQYFRGYSSIEDMLDRVKYEWGSCNKETFITKEFLGWIKDSILYEDIDLNRHKIGFL